MEVVFFTYFMLESSSLASLVAFGYGALSNCDSTLTRAVAGRDNPVKNPPLLGVARQIIPVYKCLFHQNKRLPCDTGNCVSRNSR